jgi:TPR repeat protein
MHDLFRTGWALHQQRKIPEALEYYREARRYRDRCASFQLNCMESFGQDIPIRIDLIVDWRTISLTSEEFTCLYECYSMIHTASIKFNLGLLYLVGKQPELAIEYIKLSAKNDYPPAQAFLSSLYLFGYLLEYNYQRALKWAERSAEAGWHWGQYFLGYLYYMIKDDTKALKWYKLSADQGNREASAMVGYLYNNEQSISYYERASKMGEHTAQFNAGLYYHLKELNYERAFHWYRVAAKHCDPQAQNNLGILYDKVSNHQKAFKYFYKSASQNNSYGLFNTAQYYKHGLGTNKNYALALFYYTQAKKQGCRNVDCYIDAIMKYQTIIQQALLDHDKTLTHQWFRNFLMELTEKHGLDNWDDGLIRSWIMDAIVEHFKVGSKESKRIAFWFEKLNIPIGISVEK